MSPAQVRAVFPEAETYEDWMGGNLNDSILYQGLIVGFDRCNVTGPLVDSRFVEVRLHGRSDIIIYGKNICDWTRDAVTSHLNQSGIRYQTVNNRGVLVRTSTLSLTFDESGCHLVWIEMWRPMQDWR
jgi:hypothetical protein